MKTEIGRMAECSGGDAHPASEAHDRFQPKAFLPHPAHLPASIGIGLLRGEPFQMMLLSISLAVAAIPEALPAPSRSPQGATGWPAKR
jgi:hypothetical protein